MDTFELVIILLFAIVIPLIIISIISDIMNEKTGKKIMKMHKKGMTTYAIAKQLDSSDIAWLSQHKQSIEKKVKTLKRTAVFVFYSVAAYAIFAVLFAIFSIITYLSLSGAALFAVISCFAIGFAGASIPSGFEGEALIGVFLGVIIGLIIAL